MKILFTEESWDDYFHWQAMDKSIMKRINQLIRDLQRDPFSGIGKPEPLKLQLKGCWSRRIDQERRLVYEVVKENLRIISSRYHYN